MTVTSDNSVVIAYTKADGKVYAAKPSSAGAAVFPLTETVICDYKSYENWKSSSESPFNSNISIVSDQFGGAIISWIDYRYYPILGNCVFAQKINSTGIRLWDASTGANDLNGVMMGVINEYAQEKYSLHSSTYNDGGVPYGLLILWKDYFASPSKADIYYNTR